MLVLAGVMAAVAVVSVMLSFIRANRLDKEAERFWSER
jgi:hypothetical protein